MWTTKQKSSKKKRQKTRKRKTSIVSEKVPISSFNKSIITINGKNCSPKPTSEMNNFSCYSNDSILELKRLWNIKHSNQQITSTDPYQIYILLKKYLSSVCDKEICWLNQNLHFGKINENIKNSFAPVSPAIWKKNPNEWLTNYDIMNVMRQYEQSYPCFSFIGPSPIDFDKKINRGECVWNELCRFELRQYIQSKILKIGVIFNTDPHNRRGQHWISLFIDIKKQDIVYFDSAANGTPQEVNQFIRRVVHQGNRMVPKIKFKVHKITNVMHQLKNTECGVYSLFFIINLLENNIDSNYLKTNILRDEYIERFRKIYFND